MTPDVLIYSLLSLTLIRMLPNVIALTGTGEKLETKMFLAWFGDLMRRARRSRPNLNHP